MTNGLGRERAKSEGRAEEANCRRSRTFRVSREVIIGYLAEILILEVEGGASKSAKGDGGWPVQRSKGEAERRKGEGRESSRRSRRGRRRRGRSGTLPGSAGGPEMYASTFLSLMVEEERRKKYGASNNKGGRQGDERREDAEGGESGRVRFTDLGRDRGISASAPHLKLIITLDSM